MAFTQRLIESFMQTARSSTSGYQDDDDINRNLAMIDNEIMETLAPLYSVNGKVQDLLQPFVKPISSTVVDGSLVKPTDYVQYVDSTYKGNPIYPRNPNEVSIINTSPTRKPTLDKGPYFVYFTGGDIKYLPKEIDAVDVVYLRRPVPGSVSFTISDLDDSDYIEMSVVKEIEWPERAFNLFYYHLLEKFGVEMSNQLASEYSQLGINREITKTA